MKCIKSIKATKNTEIGVIKRIADKEADSEVKSGYWKYIPKSEWKKKNLVEVDQSETTEKSETKKNNKKTKSK